MIDNQEQLRDTVPPVVGIGASAGGLEALLELFAHLPQDTGFAFAVLLHSAPEHEYLLADILSDKTPLPVREAREGDEIEANHVYIASPELQVGWFAGRLVFAAQAEPDSPRKPIDRLFRSLARELESKAVAVVLSGTGTDGTAGIKAIKCCGGLALVQAPDSALFDTMPRSALELGCVDFALPPERLAGELARLGRQPLSEAGGRQAPCIGEADLIRLFQALQTACGIDFSHYKRSTIRRRLTRRLALNKLRGVPEYLEFLEGNLAEATALCQDFLIRVTGFFREPDIYAALAETVFPRLLQGRSAAVPIRIWVPGCSTGEEVYSIAIALLEYLEGWALPVPILLFGTDISGEAIERARAGLYPARIQQQMSPERLRRFFIRTDGQYQISPAIRSLCVFAQHDVARDPPFSRLDLISCCNLLIYFGPILQRRVAATFHYALKPGGFLVLGPSESIGQHCAKLFSQIDKRRKIYARKNEPGRLLLDLSHISENLMPFDPVKAAPEEMPPQNSGTLQREIEHLILNRYTPAGLVIDEFQNVVQFTGRMAPYLEIRPGPASLSLQRLVRPALHMVIASAISEARAVDGPVRREELRAETDGGERLVHLNVAPLKESTGEIGYFLVTFEELSPKHEAGASAGWLSGVLSGWFRGRGAEGDEAPPRLKQELETAQNQLHAILEAYDSSREELKSVQEELLSVREEFQSTNEELETAKEELQAANEELITANEELRLRNAELSQAMAEAQGARDYTQAIVDSTQAALLVLDPELRIRHCNPAFSEIFRLSREAAEGRLLGELGEGAWNRPGLLDLLRTVAAEGARVENFEVSLEFPGLGERVLMLNARKLVGEAELSSLVLLSMLDVTACRSAEARIKKQTELLDQAHEAILIWSFGDGIRYWNRGAEELYGWTRDEALGRMSHDLLKTRRSIDPEEFDRRLREDRQWIGEIFQTTRDGRELVVDSRYTVQEQLDGSLLVLETNRDITGRKKAEESLRRADRQKDEFLAMLAHELRNPLAPLRNALGIMQRANPNRVPAEEIWAMMDRQVTKLTRIVDDLLDIARITRGQIELRREIIDLVVLVGHAAESVVPQMKACEHRLTLSLPDRPVRIDADPVRIEQIVENLLSNAAKYTPPGGRIEVTLETPNGEAVLRVRDNGQGICPEALSNIFELFMQADRGLDRRQGGLGIGLTLVRRLAELHGGRVEAESDGPGLGSRFTVRLPLAEPDRDSATPGPRSGAAAPSGTTRRVLVVDDNSDAADSTAMLVRSCGHEVKLAYSAATALDTAARFRPDVVLLDIGLPDMDGYRLAQRLRALDGLERAYLVAVSGYGTQADRAASKAAGIDRHLVKPVDLEALEDVLGRSGTEAA